METLVFSKEELLKIYTAMFVFQDETLKGGFTPTEPFQSAIDKVRNALTS